MITVAGVGAYGPADYYCDGTADEVEINAAIAAENGRTNRGTVKLVGEQFTLADSIVLAASVSLDGQATRLVITTAVTYMVTADHTNYAQIRNTTFVDSGGLGTYMFWGDSATGIVVTNCRFEGGSDRAVMLSDCVAALITDNLFTGNYTDPSVVHLSGGSQSTVARNHFTGITAQYGIYLQATLGAVVRDNYIVDQYGGPTVTPVIGIYDATGYDNSLHSNVLRHIWSGGMTGQTAQAIYLSASNRAHISSNHGFGNGSLILYGGCDSTSSPQMSGGPNLVNITAARSTDVTPYDGSYSYKLTKTSTAGGGDAIFSFTPAASTSTTEMAGIIGGENYTFTGRLQVPTGVDSTAVLVRIGYYTTAWTDDDFNTTGLDAWSGWTLEFTPNTTAGASRVYVSIGSTQDQNDAVYLDYVRLQPDGAGNDYAQQIFDGGSGTLTGNNSWEL